MFTYKVVSVPKNIALKRGKDWGTTIAEFVEDTINKMANEGWEFYRADNYQVEELVGCLGALAGNKGTSQNFNLLVFRKESK